MLIQSYVEISVENSNWAEVACESKGGKVIGMLYGEIRPGSKRSFAFTSLLTELSMFSRMMLTGSLKESGNRAMTFLRFILTEIKVALNNPRSDAYVDLFLVDPEYKGKGAGKGLMDRFVKDAIMQGATSISLYTENTGSNWRFYEKYGFKKVNTFKDNGTSFYYNKKVTGMIYHLNLKDTVQKDTFSTQD
ncbi:MAG: GNAT family N-acetyltransferase [Thermoplasmata archaeon]|nr:GNAT family N-acetyltransferase [Thermoplasmata archaeon]